MSSETDSTLSAVENGYSRWSTGDPHRDHLSGPTP